MPTRIGDRIDQPPRPPPIEAGSLPYPWNNWNQEPSRSPPTAVEPPIQTLLPAVTTFPEALPHIPEPAVSPDPTPQPLLRPVDPVPVFEVLSSPAPLPGYLPPPLAPESASLPLEVDLPALLALPVTGPESLPPPPQPVIMPEILLPAPEPESEPKPESVREPESEPKPESKSVREPGSKQKPESKSVREPGSEQKPESESVREPGSEQKPEPVPEPEPASESTPEPLQKPLTAPEPAPPQKPLTAPESSAVPIPFRPALAPFQKRLPAPVPEPVGTTDCFAKQSEAVEQKPSQTVRESRELSGWWKAGVATLLVFGVAQAMWGDGLRQWFQSSRESASQEKPPLASQESPTTVVTALVESTTTSSIEPTVSSVEGSTVSDAPTPVDVAPSPETVHAPSSSVSAPVGVSEALSPTPATQSDQAEQTGNRTVQPEKNPPEPRFQATNATPRKKTSKRKTVARHAKHSPASRQSPTQTRVGKVASPPVTVPANDNRADATAPFMAAAPQEEPVHFVVSYGCFSSLKEVEGRQEKIKAKGWPTTLSHYPVGQTMMNCLYGGPFRSVREADQATELFEEKGCLQLPKIPLRTP
ncbi:MAG: hypothetical protein HQL99_15775 [Magnetococcales bacterium]|nr:hypothetical protein [Magnetococcales bacterium]